MPTLKLVCSICTRTPSHIAIRSRSKGGDVIEGPSPFRTRGRAYFSRTPQLTLPASTFCTPSRLKIEKPHRFSPTPVVSTREFAGISTADQMTATSPPPEQSMHTSGALDSVWVHKQPYATYPRFPVLTQYLETDICVIGAGISGISAAYELVRRGKDVTLIEARDVLSGETGRTSGHLTNDLDDGYLEIAKKHGEKGAKVAAESHAWARNRIGEIPKELQIDC